MNIEAQKNAYTDGFRAAMRLCNARPSVGVVQEAWETYKMLEGLKEDTPVHNMRGLMEKMQADKPYAWAWHCNIAMPIMDSIGISHEQANNAARYVMLHSFGVDVTQYDEWKSLEKQWADVRSEENQKRADWDGSFAHGLDIDEDMRVADQRDKTDAIFRGTNADVAEADYIPGVKSKDGTGYDAFKEALNLEVAQENAARFRKELMKISKQNYHTPLSQLLTDAVILLLERVK